MSEITGDHTELLDVLSKIIAGHTLEGITVDADYRDVPTDDEWRRVEPTGRITVTIAAKRRAKVGGAP